MSRVYVCGVGAVSPAGWTTAALRDSLLQNQPLAIQALARPGWDNSLRMRPVPNPVIRPAFLAHPRLRRTSPITHYAVAAALEAVAPVRAANHLGLRIGVITCLQSGCVQYSFRFFEEALKDPATASPLLFPETVFAAPGSHVATIIENTPALCTLTGDPATYLQGLALACDWLEAGRVDACIVLGAEEINWLLADALWQLDHSAVISAGAGAICLSHNPDWSMGVELELITDAHSYSSRLSRQRAAQQMRMQLPGFMAGELLCDGLGDLARTDAAEIHAWAEWPGSRISPKKVLGEGLMAASAWQCVAACDLLAVGKFVAANVSLVGANQQAIGARFKSAKPLISDLSLH